MIRIRTFNFAFRHMLLVCLFALVGCESNERSVQLSFDYQPGESYAYEMADDVIYETKDCEENITRVEHHQKQMTNIDVLEPDSTDHFYNLLVSFVIIADTIIYPKDFEGKKEQRSKKFVGRRSKYTLAMRHDGEIVFVKGKTESATEYDESA